MILDRIVAQKKQTLDRECQQYLDDYFMKSMRFIKPVFLKSQRSLKATMTGEHIGIIGEVKKASPSSGIIRVDFNPVDLATEYSQCVDAISVLTEEAFFRGSPEDLINVRNTVNRPILRKDFIVDERQLYTSKFMGADAVLLIAAILTPLQLKRFTAIANALHLETLLEVHDERELAIALNAGATMIGINNRNLKTFQTDLKTTAELIRHIPKDIPVISESGIKTREDLQYLKSLGVSGVLIGEAFMAADNITNKVKELRYE